MKASRAITEAAARLKPDAATAKKEGGYVAVEENGELKFFYFPKPGSDLWSHVVVDPGTLIPLQIAQAMKAQQKAKVSVTEKTELVILTDFGIRHAMFWDGSGWTIDLGGAKVLKMSEAKKAADALNRTRKVHVVPKQSLHAMPSTVVPINSINVVEIAEAAVPIKGGPESAPEA